MSYVSLNEAMIKHNCKLLTQEDEFNEIKKTTHCVKVRYIASCGHEHLVFSNVFKSRLTGVRCPSCVCKTNNSSRIGDGSRTPEGSSLYLDMEDKTIEYITELLKPVFTVVKVVDGCLADFVIKPLHVIKDEWLAIQVKTTSKPVRDYGFHCSSKYEDCIMFFFCMSDKKMWLMEGNNMNVSKKISIGLKKSKYDDFLVTKENVSEKFYQFYLTQKHFAFSILNTPISICQQKEQEFRKNIEEKCPFLKFDYPTKSGLVYDFCVNGFKVQEKTGQYRKDRKNSITFGIKKNNGYIDKRLQKQPYKIDDNDFYWLNFPDNRFFILIPQMQLIRDDNRLTTSISLLFKNNSCKKYNEYLFDLENINIEKLNAVFGL